MTSTCRLIAFIGLMAALTAHWSDLSALRAETLLRVGMADLPPTRGNPFRTTGTPNIYTWSATFDGLTRIDENGALGPWLAVSWENVDERTWRIRLRQDVLFSNGKPFTADAVKTVVDYFGTADAAREIVARELGFIVEARIVDDHTVDLITDKPTPFLPRALPVMYMVEPDQWRRLGAEGFADAPVATGPFHPVRYTEARIDFEAFRGSWRAPKIDRLTILDVPDASARAQALLADQLDLAYAIGPDEVYAIEAGGGVGVSWPVASVWAIHFHLNRPGPWQDLRVRKAINLAINRDALITTLLDGRTRPATQPAPRSAYGYNPDLPPIPFDPEKARALLAEAGYADGFPLIVQGVIGAGPSDASMYQLVAQDLATIGIDMQIRVFPVPQLIRSVIEGDWNGDAFGLNYSTEPTIDALRLMNNNSCLWSHPWYCDQRIMPKVRRAMVEMDEEKGLKLRHDIMSFYRHEYPAIFLYEFARFAGLRPEVRNFKEVHGFIAFEDIELAEP